MQLQFFIILDFIDFWIFPKKTQKQMDFNNQFCKKIFKITSIWLTPSKLKIYILLALLISKSATMIDIKTGVQAAMKGVKIPLTPNELEKKDKI